MQNDKQMIPNCELTNVKIIKIEEGSKWTVGDLRETIEDTPNDWNIQFEVNGHVSKIDSVLPSPQRQKLRVTVSYDKEEMPFEPKSSIYNEVSDLIRQDKFIYAVKRYREYTGCSLKEAKEYCDGLKAEIGPIAKKKTLNSYAYSSPSLKSAHEKSIDAITRNQLKELIVVGYTIAARNRLQDQFNFSFVEANEWVKQCMNEYNL